MGLLIIMIIILINHEEGQPEQDEAAAAASAFQIAMCEGDNEPRVQGLESGSETATAM